jgi:mannose-6-phosphate isomerase-like protein (cupin superfamily)
MLWRPERAAADEEGGAGRGTIFVWTSMTNPPRHSIDEAPAVAQYDLDDMMVSPTAALFEGKARAGIDISLFIVRTPLGGAVELHVHPYSETFVMLDGHGRWTAGDVVTELRRDQILVVPANTPHGFRNVGDVPLLVVSVHESGKLEQTFLGIDPT